MRMLGSLFFWGFMVASSILLFPVAVVIWLAAVRCEKRREWSERSAARKARV